MGYRHDRHRDGGGRPSGAVVVAVDPRRARAAAQLWGRTFDTAEELRRALIEFKEEYNRRWILQRRGYTTPIETALAALQRVARAA